MPIGNFFKKLISRASGRPDLIHPDEEAIHDEALKSLPLGARRTVRYPPFMEGFPAYLTSDYLLSLQGELYQKLLGGVGLPKAQFDEIVRPVILNYSRFVHLLPASENHHHCGPGGLLRHGLEVACFSMNGAKNTAFDSRRPPSERSHRAVRWNVAGLLCGLLHDTGKAVTDMQVVYPPTGLKWVHSECTVEEWAKKHGLRKYYIEWNKGRHQRHVMKSRDLVMTLCPPQTLTWLMDGGEDIVDALMDAIIGKEDSPLYRAMMMADGKSTKLDMATGESPQYMTGVPVIKLLTNAMNRLTQEGTWSINKPGARVWTTTQGVFIAWNSGAQEIIDLILKDKVEAIPRTPNTLLMRLIDQSVAERGPDGEMFWEVAPLCLQKGDKPMILRCMKLTSADTLFAYDPIPAPVSVMIRKAGEMIDYPADTEAQAIAESSTGTNPSGSPSDELKESALESGAVQGEKTPPDSQASKPKKKAPASQPAASTADLPVLKEEDAPAQEKPRSAKLTDPVLQKLADIEPGSDDESGKELFMSSVLLCMSGLPAEEPEPVSTEPEPTALAKSESKKLSLKPSAKPSQENPSEPTLDDDHAGAPVIAGTAPKGKQTSLTSILARDKSSAPKKKPKSDEQTRAAPAQPEISQSPEMSIAPQPEPVERPISNGKRDLEITPEEQSALNAHPELAKQLLGTLERPDIFNAYLRRVFVPLQSATPDGLDDAIAAQLIACGWVWHDFTDASGVAIYTANKVQGVVLANWLGNIITRNLDRNLQVTTSSAVGDDQAEALYPLAQALIAQASPETLPNGVTVLSLSLHKMRQVAATHEASHEDGLTALHLFRDTVYTWRRKVALILPLEGEIKRLNDNG